jgi:heme/copper-type cytochrome/quinol oxidase subunit 2
MTDQTHSTQPPASKAPLWLVGLSYVVSFVLGALIDIIRHSWDRIAPAVQADQIDGAIIQRGVIALVLIVIVVGGVTFGSRWSGQRLGKAHRTGLQVLFVATPIIVYILEH